MFQTQFLFESKAMLKHS